MNRRDFDIDHIDPRWEDGRDYQLVCGLDCPENYSEREPAFNKIKSNRFLPWRWSRDEIGVVPKEYGDLAQFLVDGEWVLLEFLSDEYMEAAKYTTGPAQFYLFENLGKVGSIALHEWRNQNPEWKNKHVPYLLAKLKEWQERNSDVVEAQLERLKQASNKWRQENPEETRKKALNASNAADEWREKNYEEFLNHNRKLAKMRYKCTVTGYESNAAGLSRYQKKRGIDPSNRIRLQ